MHLQKCLTKIAALSLGAILLVTSAAQAAGNSKAKQVIDGLYCFGNRPAIRDLIIEMDCTNNDEQTGQLTPASKDKIYFKAPNKLRVDATIIDPGGPMDQRQSIIIRDGVTMWHYLSTGQYPVKKQPDSSSPTANMPFGLQRYPIDDTKNYEFGGQKTIEGVQGQEIVITNPQDDGDKHVVCVDMKRRVPLRHDYTRTDGDKHIAITVEYSAITALSDGRYFPFLLKIYEDGKLQKVRAYRGVSLNVGLDDSFFNQMSGIMR